MRKKLFGTALLTVGGALTSCSPSSSSGLKHDIGHTSNAREQSLETCAVAHPDSSGYLKRLFDRITERNPDTFKGVYDPSRFCLNLVVDDVVNAFAQPEDGSITFHAGMLLMAKNDAQVAEVLAHEIAHVTMQSGYVPVEQKYKELSSDASVMAASKKKNAAYEAYVQVWEESTLAYDALMEKQEALVGSLDHSSQSQYKKLSDAQAEVEAKLSALEDEFSAKMGKLREDVSLSEEGKKKAYEQMIADYERTKAAHIEAIDKGYEKIEAFLTSVAYQSTYGSQWRSLSQKYQDLHQEMTQADAVLTDVSEAFGAEVDRVMGHGTNANWTEQEADEVGLELFVRAGFDPNEFVGAHFNFLERSASAEAAQKCRAMLDAIVAGKIVAAPERGNSSHPTDCWRVYDLAKTELRDKHAKDYAEIIKENEKNGESLIVDLPNSKLKELQEKLRKELAQKTNK